MSRKMKVTIGCGFALLFVISFWGNEEAPCDPSSIPRIEECDVVADHDACISQKCGDYGLIYYP